MLRLGGCVLFACVALTAICNVEAKPPSHIKGGDNAAIGEFPYVVSISRHGIRHYCGGAIISPRHILTAGHCISGDGKMTIYSGVVDLDDTNVVERNVKEVKLHSKYSPQTKLRGVRNDIGILVLDTDLEFNERIKKIDLPNEAPVAGHSSNNVVAGWGAVKDNQSEYQLILQKTAIRLLNDLQCSSRSMVVERPESICGYDENAALCVGDSGSPLVSGNRIIGVASTSSCTIGVAGSYTSVYNYIDWIKSVMES